MPKELLSTISLPCADSKYIDKAVSIMKTAKRPVILRGGGALKAKVNEKILLLPKLGAQEYHYTEGERRRNRRF